MQKCTSGLHLFIYAWFNQLIDSILTNIVINNLVIKFSPYCLLSDYKIMLLRIEWKEWSVRNKIILCNR